MQDWWLLAPPPLSLSLSLSLPSLPSRAIKQRYARANLSLGSRTNDCVCAWLPITRSKCTPHTHTWQLTGPVRRVTAASALIKSAEKREGEHWRWCCCCFASLWYLCFYRRTCVTVSPIEEEEEEGGFVLWVRHTHTHVSPLDMGWTNCGGGAHSDANEHLVDWEQGEGGATTLHVCWCAKCVEFVRTRKTCDDDDSAHFSCKITPPWMLPKSHCEATTKGGSGGKSRRNGTFLRQFVHSHGCSIQ